MSDEFVARVTIIRSRFFMSNSFPSAAWIKRYADKGKEILFWRRMLGCRSGIGLKIWSLFTMKAGRSGGDSRSAVLLACTNSNLKNKLRT